MPFGETPSYTQFPLGYKRARRSRVYSEDGRRILLAEFYFDSRGLPHREPDEGPAIRTFNADGLPFLIQYRWHGLLHRDLDRGPACLYYQGDDQTWEHESWYRYGRLHRRNGPALIERYANGLTKYAEWALHGYEFREPHGGPYRITYDENGSVTGEDWSEGNPPNRQASLKWLRQKFGRQVTPLKL
jgi:hypothetical protein